MKANRNICPRKAFCEDLSQFIKLSIWEGFSIVAALDANENMKIGSIARSFTALELINSITTITSATPPGTYIRGPKQIDRI